MTTFDGRRSEYDRRIFSSNRLKLIQRTRLPLLSKMAIDIHSIPVMSAEPERVFSGAKYTISDQRNSLKSETIELLEYLKS